MVAIVSNEERIKYELIKLGEDLEFKQKFNFLLELMHEIALVKGWWNPEKTFTEQVMMMVTETAEVIEEYRNENGSITDIYIGEAGKPEGVPIEFADLFIREADTCGRYDIPLFDSIIMKSLFNLNRSHRHGNKRV